MIGHHFPPNGGRGGQWKDHRAAVNGILWVLCSGAAWRDLPERYGPFQTVHGRLQRWRADGTWEKVLAALRVEADERGLIDWAQWNADSTSVGARGTRPAPAKKGAGTDDSGRAREHEPADDGLGRCRGGFGSKLHVMTDGRGNVLQVVVTRGNRNEVPVLGPLLASALANNPGRRPKKLACDKGYGADRFRTGLPAVGIQPVIPMRDNEHVDDRDGFGKFDKRAYRGRNVVERAVAKLKEFRRIATRYEKLASSYCAMLSLANIVLYLRILDS